MSITDLQDFSAFLCLKMLPIKYQQLQMYILIIFPLIKVIDRLWIDFNIIAYSKKQNNPHCENLLTLLSQMHSKRSLTKVTTVK